MSGNLGGQRRTVLCGCGWQKKGSVREVNMVFKIHQKVCPNQIKVTLPEFDAGENAFNNVSESKHGHMVKKAGKTITVHKEGTMTEKFIKGHL